MRTIMLALALLCVHHEITTWPTGKAGLWRSNSLAYSDGPARRVRGVGNASVAIGNTWNPFACGCGDPFRLPAVEILTVFWLSCWPVWWCTQTLVEMPRSTMVDARSITTHDILPSFLPSSISMQGRKKKRRTS